MKVTIVPDDNKIIINGRFIISADFVFSSNVHAIQWDGVAGHIEYKDGSINTAIMDQSEIQEYINQFQAEAEKQDTKPVVNAWEEAVYSAGVWTVQNKPDAKLIIQAINKASCKAFILANYSEETQRNAALGLYTPEVVTAMADHIAAIIAVENTTWELIEASDDPESVPKPVWPEA